MLASLCLLILLALFHPNVSLALELRVHGTATDPLTKLYTAERIEGQQTYDLLKLLVSVPGVTFINRNGLKEILVRGGRPSQTQVRIDGIVVNDPSTIGSVYNFDYLEAELVQEMHVTMGVEALQYGSGGAGVVDVRLKKPKGPPKAWARAEGGSFKTRTATLGGQGAGDWLKGLLIAKTDRQGAGGRFNPVHQNTVADWHQKQQVYAKVMVPVTPQHEICLRGQLGEQKDHMDDLPAWLPIWRDSFAKAKQQFAAASSQYTSQSGRLENELHVAVHQTQRRYYSKAYAAWPEVYEGGRGALTEQVTYQWSDALTGLLEAGFQEERWTDNRGTAHQHLSFVRGRGTWSPASWIQLIPAMRLDIGPAHVHRPTAQCRLQMDVTQKTQFMAGLGTGLRFPSLFERKGLLPYTRPNLGLKPEAIRQMEMGLKHAFLEDRLTGQVTIFRSVAREAIVYAPPSLRYENRLSRRTKGVETCLVAQLVPDWMVTVSHTYVTALDKPRSPILRVPHHKVCADGTYQILPDLSVFIGAVYESRRRDYGPGYGVRLPATTDVRFGGVYQPFAHLKVFVRCENALNQRREALWGYGRRGVGFFAGMTVLSS